MKLQFISCKQCKKDYLVGINGKNVQGKGSGGNNYVAFSNDEINEGDNIKNVVPCPSCGIECEVKESKEVCKTLH